MAKNAVFTLKLEAELRAEFMEAAAAEHRPASQVTRELMREYVQRHRVERDYQNFLAGKVEDARAAIAADSGRSAEEVEAEFARRRS